MEFSKYINFLLLSKLPPLYCAMKEFNETSIGQWSMAFFTNTTVGTKLQKKVASWFVTNYRITEWLRLKGTSGGHLVQYPVQAGWSTACCPRLGSEKNKRKKHPQNFMEYTSFFLNSKCYSFVGLVFSFFLSFFFDVFISFGTRGNFYETRSKSSAIWNKKKGFYFQTA